MLFHMCLFWGKAWSESWIGNGELDPICSLLSHGLNDDPVSHRRLDRCECQAPGIANMLCNPAGKSGAPWILLALLKAVVKSLRAAWMDLNIFDENYHQKCMEVKANES